MIALPVLSVLPLVKWFARIVTLGTTMLRSSPLVVWPVLQAKRNPCQDKPSARTVPRECSWLPQDRPSVCRVMPDSLPMPLGSSVVSSVLLAPSARNNLSSLVPPGAPRARLAGMRCRLVKCSALTAPWVSILVKLVPCSAPTVWLEPFLAWSVSFRVRLVKRADTLLCATATCVWIVSVASTPPRRAARFVWTVLLDSSSLSLVKLVALTARKACTPPCRAPSSAHSAHRASSTLQLSSRFATFARPASTKPRLARNLVMSALLVSSRVRPRSSFV